MPRLPVLSGAQVCGILAEHAFAQVRQRGSHVIMQLKSGDSTITIPAPNHREVRLGTLRSIIRQSRLPTSSFTK